MALRRNSILAGIIVASACLSSPVLADDSTFTDRDDKRSSYLDDNYIYDYMTHRDSITVGLGDAPTSNIIIQHPTPWPSYVNKTKIKTPAAIGITALDNMMNNLASGGSSSSGAVVGTGSAPMTSSTVVLPSASGGN